MTQTLHRDITDKNFDEVDERLRKTLADNGFGIITEIDVTATFKKKLDVDFRRYTILGACNPGFAHKALEHDLQIGTLLPCNVCLYEDDAGTVVIDAVDPAQLLPTDSPQLKDVADTVRKSILAAIEAV